MPTKNDKKTSKLKPPPKEKDETKKEKKEAAPKAKKAAEKIKKPAVKASKPKKAAVEPHKPAHAVEPVLAVPKPAEEHSAPVVTEEKPKEKKKVVKKIVKEIKEKLAVPAPAAPAPVIHEKPAAPKVAAPQPPAAVKPPEVKPEPPKVAAPPKPPEPPKYLGIINISETSTVRDMAEKMKKTPTDLLRKLLSMGSLVTINQRLDKDSATLLAHEFNYDVKFESIYSDEVLVEEEKEDPKNLKPRHPVVTIMGHVDHGKTSLLDAIRKSKITEGEAGGITQHIGAYTVKIDKGNITFLDTPGHEAFTAMRSRGAQATDIVVLVVSAADGVMPQTVEAIDHAKAAGVPIIVAVNKIDLPTANPQQVRQELNKYGLIPEDWGGDTIFVDISARKGINIDQLLELIAIKAELMELKANPDRLAAGVVIEARLDPRRGPVATVLIQKGTLHVSDNFIVGTIYGKVRAMIDEHGQRQTEAKPGTPIEVLGITSAPQAGDKFIVVENESKAKQIAQTRQIRTREESLRPRHHLSLEDINTGKVKELRLIVKADVQGSVGALLDSIERLSNAEISVRIIHSGAGAITESDVTLAAASDAMIVGFNIKPDSVIERMADREGVNITVYRIIYDLMADVKAAMEGLLEPGIKEISIGKAQVKQIFKVSKVGTIFGSIVLEGKMLRGAKARIIRDNVIVHESSIFSLRRFKEDAREVEKGYECGIVIENYTDIKIGDIIEAYRQEKVARKL
jgi:translation initiation factor IF-2